MPDKTGAGDATTWVRSNLSASASASGRTFLRVLPDTRVTHDDRLITDENFSPEPGKLAVLDYNIHFPKAGRYYVWVRAFSTGTEDNGLHVGIDDRWPESGRRMQWCEGKNEWTWGCAQRTEQNHCGEPMQIFLDVDQPGEHKVSFSMREDGFAFDQFLLTMNINDRPSGQENGETLYVSSMRDEMRFPRAEWQRGTPEGSGYDSDRLAKALEFLRGHCNDDGLSELMLIQDGTVFYEGNRTDKRHNIWSCSKSFTSTALGLMIDEGRCRLDTLGAAIEPALSEHYPDITLRDFTTMTSGYSAKGRSRWEDENEDWSWTPYDPDVPYFAPGEAFAYWDEAQMMFGRVLTALAGESLRDYLQRRLFDPIGMGTVKWGTEGALGSIPIANGCTGVEVNARQFARFGHLFLCEGDWNGRRVIPSSWIQEATTVQVPASVPVADTDRNNVLGSGAYGFNWWVNGGLTPLPLAPERTYYASGFNHNVCVVVPEWNLVIVRMGVDGNPEFGKHNVYNGFLDLLGKARLDQ